MIVVGQTKDDDTDELLNGPGSIDLGLYGEVLINIGVPPVDIVRVLYNEHTQTWQRYENATGNQLSGPGNEWLSLLIME